MSTGTKKAAVLRLDSGALIGRSDLLGVKSGPPRVVKLSAKDAYASGRVSGKEISRLQALVRQAKLIKRRSDADMQVGTSTTNQDNTETASTCFQHFIFEIKRDKFGWFQRTQQTHSRFRDQVDNEHWPFLLQMSW